MNFSGCEVKVQMENGIKPLIQLVKGNLEITPRCRCGFVGSKIIFSDGIEKEILENMNLTRRESEESGMRSSLCISTSRVIKDSCIQCGRDLLGSIQFVLGKELLKAFYKMRNEDEKEIVYGNILQVHMKVKGGWFKNFRSIKDLVSPSCRCGNGLAFPKTVQSFEQLIQQVNNFLENDNAPKPKSFISIEECKCLRCLKKAKLKTKIVVDLPENLSLPQTLKKYRAWLERMS